MSVQEPTPTTGPAPKKKRGFFKTAGIGCASIIGLIIVIAIVASVVNSGGNSKATPTPGGQVAAASTNSTQAATTEPTVAQTSTQAATMQPTVAQTPTQAATMQPTVAQTPTQAANSALGIGQTTRVGDLQLTLNKARIGQGFPSDGNQVLECDFTVKYVGTNTYDLSTLLQFQIFGSDSRKYNVTIATDGNGTLDGTLAAGQTLSGEVAFEVPVNAAPYTVRFSKVFSNSFAEWVVPQPTQ